MIGALDLGFKFGGGATPEFRAIASKIAAYGVNAPAPKTFVIPVPVTPVPAEPGDLLLAVIETQTGPTGGSIPAQPAGWTRAVSSGSTAGHGSLLTVDWRIATSSEPASYTWGTTGVNGPATGIGVMLAISGVNTSAPFDAIGAPTADTASTTSRRKNAAASVTPTTAGLLLAFYGWASPQYPVVAGTARVDPPGMTIRAAVGASDDSLMVYEQKLLAAGATGTRTVDYPVNSLPDGQGILIALKA